ncbi:hypothetical protein PUN28_013391 [Cardiocondyla obscurior]|uniref:Uncharacterized protein n=1 Tax=Cardiocondyla obscurior TaxID=286306 RepID=A0AAW2F887_9HYME
MRFYSHLLLGIFVHHRHNGIIQISLLARYGRIRRTSGGVTLGALVRRLNPVLSSLHPPPVLLVEHPNATIFSRANAKELFSDIALGDQIIRAIRNALVAALIPPSTRPGGAKELGAKNRFLSARPHRGITQILSVDARSDVLREVFFFLFFFRERAHFGGSNGLSTVKFLLDVALFDK